MNMSRVRCILFLLGVLGLSLSFAPHVVTGASPPGEANLTDAQKALLSAGLAEKKAYAEIIKQAVAAGMDCEEIVVYLCGKAGADQAAAYDIVYAGITGGCDPGKVVSGALRGGAGLQTVVRSARAAGAGREAINDAATKNGFTPVQLGNAFAGASGGGAAGGGSPGGGPISGASGSGPVIGGGAGGTVPASPSQP